MFVVCKRFGCRSVRCQNLRLTKISRGGIEEDGQVDRLLQDLLRTESQQVPPHILRNGGHSYQDGNVDSALPQPADHFIFRHRHILAGNDQIHIVEADSIQNGSGILKGVDRMTFRLKCDCDIRTLLTDIKSIIETGT